MRFPGFAFAALVAILYFTPQRLSATDLPWPDRNGPTHDGHAAPEHGTDLPLTWDERTGENLAWTIPLDGFGHSTPVVGDGKLWFTAATEDGTRQYVYCVSASDGKVLHHKRLFENTDPEPLGNTVNTYASPSCVIEEDAVYVDFGTYGVARLDTAADVVWQRRDIHCRHFRGPGSSPILWKGLLIRTMDGIDQQFLMALDKKTGTTVWRTDRTTDYGDIGPDGRPIGDGDFRKAFGTPGLVEVNGRTQVVSVGSRAAFGYDAATGKELWTIRHKDYNAAIRPLFHRNLAILNTGSRSAATVAVRLDETTRGDVSQSHVVWRRDKSNPSTSNPLVLSPSLSGTGERGKGSGTRGEGDPEQDPFLFMLVDNGIAAGVDLSTGEQLWATRLRGMFRASAVAVGDTVYGFNEQGDGFVLRPTRSDCEIAASNRLDEGMRASPVVAYNAIYLRTFGHLFKLQK